MSCVAVRSKHDAIKTSLSYRLGVETTRIAAIVVFALDRYSKSVVISTFAPGESRVELPGLLWFTYAQNRHGEFGSFSTSAVVLILLAIGVLIIFAYVFRDGLKRSPTVQLSFGAIVGGAVGNIVDRLQHLWVVDFIDFKTIWPNIFNLADSAITVGVTMLIIESLNAKPLVRKASGPE